MSCFTDMWCINAEMALGNVAEAEVDFESWCLWLLRE